MKTLLLILLLVPVVCVGQNVNIPEAQFKSLLVNSPNINTNGDSEIQVIEASVYTGAIYCQGVFISDLTGIEAFTSLTELHCGGNQLTSLDVSNNTSLTVLVCGANQLTSLDVSNNTALTFLDCSSNQLTSLDVSNNSALNGLNCQANPRLECLNVKNGNNTSFTYFLAYNPNLTCIEVDDVNYSTIYWTIISTQTSYSTDCNNACSNTSSISKLNNIPKQLIKIIDVLGREIPFKPNTPLIFKPNTPLLYIYNDGTVDRKMIIE